MTEETKTPSQEAGERLAAAREELDELLAEQRRLGEDLEAARRGDHEERMEVARSGGRIRSAISAVVSRVRDVEDRREALPHEVRSARLRVLELEREHQDALYADLETPEATAYAEFKKLD